MSRLAFVMTAFLAVVLAPAIAQADQCAFVSKKNADDALALIDKGATIISFCQPCGDTTPQKVKVESVSDHATGFEGTWEVLVNGQGIDLAYTFVENGDGKYVNLSKMVDCPSEGVACLLDSGLAVLPDTCGMPDDAKEDRLDSESGGGCVVGAHRGGGPADLLLALALLGLARRRLRPQ